MNIYSQEVLISLLNKAIKSNETLSTKLQSVDSIILSGFDFNTFKTIKNIGNEKGEYELFYKNGQLLKLSKKIDLEHIDNYELHFYPINKNINSAYIYLKSKNESSSLVDGFFIFDSINKKTFFVGVESMCYEQGEFIDNFGNIIFEEFYISNELSERSINIIINVDAKLKSISRFNLSNGKFISSSDINHINGKIFETLYIYDTRHTQSIKDISLKEFYSISEKWLLNVKPIIICDAYPQHKDKRPLWFSASLFYNRN